MKRLLQLILIGILIMCFSRCSTTTKIKSITSTSIDSSSITNVDSNVIKLVDSTSVKKDNTITTVEKEDNYVKETVIDFGTGLTKKMIDSAIASGKPFTSGLITAADYFSQVRKITIRETGIKKEKQVIAANRVDSAALKSNEKITFKKEVKTDLSKTETVKNKEVKRTSFWGWLWLLLLIPAYLVYRNWDKIKLFI